MITKKYKIIHSGRVMAEVQYPANAENCWWYTIQVWNEKTGFIKSAQHLTEDGVQFDLVEA